MGVGEVVVGNPAVAIDAPKEDYRVRSTDYGARKRITEGCEPWKGANRPEADAKVKPDFRVRRTEYRLLR